ncbi:MAG TPA: hypothetical protein VFZ72_06315 [Jiangellaceae bacterium]
MPSAVTAHAAERRISAAQSNERIAPAATGLPRDSVGNVTALVTADNDHLDQLIGHVPDYLTQDVERGLRRVLRV